MPMQLASARRQCGGRGGQDIGLAVPGWNERLDNLSIFGDVHPGGRVIDPPVEADHVLCVAAVHDCLRRGSGVVYMQRASLGWPARHEQHCGHHARYMTGLLSAGISFPASARLLEGEDSLPLFFMLITVPRVRRHIPARHQRDGRAVSAVVPAIGT